MAKIRAFHAQVVARCAPGTEMHQNVQCVGGVKSDT